MKDYPTIKAEGQSVTVAAADEAVVRVEMERLGILEGVAIELAASGDWKHEPPDGVVHGLCFQTEPGKPPIRHRMNGTGRPML